MTVVIMSDEFLFCCVLWYKPAGQSISRCAEQRYIPVYIILLPYILTACFIITNKKGVETSSMQHAILFYAFSLYHINGHTQILRFCILPRTCMSNRDSVMLATSSGHVHHPHPSAQDPA
jgi:hypothetical protein